MNYLNRAVMVLVLSLSAATGLWAQRGGGMDMMGGMPQMPELLNPVEGSGSEYLMTTTKNGKEMVVDVTTVVLGKEKVDGADGVWTENRMTSDKLGGEMVTKTLIVIEGPQAGMKRMIVQAPGKPPMEMGGMMMGMMMRQRPHHSSESKGGTADPGQLVGTESITVPGGTFSCQHYRKQEMSGMVDKWLSTQVSPYALVKSVSPETTMELKKVLSGEASHITGEPQKMQMPEMPHF